MTSSAVETPAYTPLGEYRWGVLSEEYPRHERPTRTADHEFWSGTEADRTFPFYAYDGDWDRTMLTIGVPSTDPRGEGMNNYANTPSDYRSWNIPREYVTFIDPPAPEVGHSLQTEEEIAALPVGTVIASHNETRAYIRGHDGWAVLDRDPSTLETYHGRFAGNGYNHVVAVNRVGDEFRKDSNRMDLLPVGTVLERTDGVYAGRVYEKTGHREWRRTGGDVPDSTLRQTQIAARAVLRIASFGSESEPLAEVTREPLPEGIDYHAATPIHPYADTIGMFRQRLAAIALGQGRSSGVDTEVIGGALNDLGCPVDDWTVSPGWVVPTNWGAEFPEGTIARAVTYNYTDLRRWNGVWHPSAFLSRRAPGNAPVMIEAIGDNIRRPTGARIDDIEAIHALRSRVYTVGQTLKARHSWCSTYEAAVANCGINGDSGHPLLTPEEVAALPEGTILRNGCLEQPILYMRDDRSPNQARTVRVSTWGEGHYAMRMTQAIRVTVFREIDSMPPGTVLSDDYTQYTVAEGKARRGASDYTIREMWTHVGHLRIHSLPDVVQTLNAGRSQS